MANIRVARRSGRILRGGRMVRETLWGDVVGTNTGIATPLVPVLLNVTGALFLDLRPFTVVRVRGGMHLQSDQTAGAELQAINYGVAVVSDQAVAIGVTAIPTPTADAGSDAWLVYQSLMTSHGAGTVDSEQGRFIEYDSRAMRRVEDGFQVVFVVETDIAGLTQGVNFRNRARLLIKLH